MRAETGPAPIVEVPLDAWLFEVLTFAPGTALHDLRRRFAMLLSERWGEWIGAYTLREREAGERLGQRLLELPTQAFYRIIIAPETVRQLLWPLAGALPEADSVRFFERAIEAERALCGLDYYLAEPAWTALGDRIVGLKGSDGGHATVGLPTLVLGDPANRNPLAPPPDSDPKSEKADRLSPPNLALVIKQLVDVHCRLETIDPRLADFSRELNITLVLRCDSARQGFQSSSPERFVGRSILWNPEHPSVGLDDLAEAVVHEGIHTVLDMADALISRVSPKGERWVTDPTLYDGVSRTTSPWTGRPLDVPTYVHGFFVWFGLLCFWSKAASHGTFDSATARRRMLRAGAPFATRIALKPLEPFATSIRSDVLQLLRTIEDDVSEAFGELAGEACA